VVVGGGVRLRWCPGLEREVKEVGVGVGVPAVAVAPFIGSSGKVRHRDPSMADGKCAIDCRSFRPRR
jgi:hypothetical protein